MGLAYQIALIAILLLLGVFSSRLSTRLNMPVLLLFLGVGMLFGAGDMGEWQFATRNHKSVEFANIISTVAMAFILYAGGLETKLSSIRKVLVPGILLSTVGVFLTAAVLGAAVCWILGWSPAWGFLLGTIVSSTDAAAVFSILRSKQVSLKGNLANLLEFESGSNDPMAALLTLFMISYLDIYQGTDLWSFSYYFPLKMLIGIGVGVGIGYMGCWCFNRAKLEYEGLYFVLGIAVVLLSYSASEALFGNGFMASYCCGVTMGNRRFNYKRANLRLNNGLAWLMQVTMFTVLGLLVTLKDLVRIPAEGWTRAAWVQGTLLALVLMFIARPLAVMLTMLGSKFNYRERILVAWVGLRGAAPIVLATFPLAARLQGDVTCGESAGRLFNLVFCMVIASVTIQSRTLMPLARLLKLDRPFRDKERSPLELEETGVLNSVMKEFEVRSESPCINKTLAELEFPGGVLILLIRRGGSFIMARGNTEIKDGDGVLLMGDEQQIAALQEKYFPGGDYSED